MLQRWADLFWFYGYRFFPSPSCFSVATSGLVPLPRMQKSECLCLHLFLRSRPCIAISPYPYRCYCIFCCPWYSRSSEGVTAGFWEKTEVKEAYTATISVAQRELLLCGCVYVDAGLAQLPPCSASHDRILPCASLFTGAKAL